jgi:hypothetical protein
LILQRFLPSKQNLCAIITTEILKSLGISRRIESIIGVLHVSVICSGLEQEFGTKPLFLRELARNKGIYTAVDDEPTKLGKCNVALKEDSLQI